MEQFYQNEFYFKQISNDPEKLHNIIRDIFLAFPDAKLVIEKFSDDIQISRGFVDIELDVFLNFLKQSEPIGASIKRENIPAYKSKSGQEESVLEFFVRGVDVENEEHCLWIRVEDSAKNRTVLEKIIE
jgi:hypothetical protein